MAVGEMGEMGGCQRLVGLEVEGGLGDHLCHLEVGVEEAGLEDLCLEEVVVEAVGVLLLRELGELPEQLILQSLLSAYLAVWLSLVGTEHTGQVVTAHSTR